MFTLHIYVDHFVIVFGLLYLAGIAFCLSGKKSVFVGGALVCAASCFGMLGLCPPAFVIVAMVAYPVVLLAGIRECRRVSDNAKEKSLVPCPHCGRENAPDCPICPHCDSHLRGNSQGTL